MGYLIVIKEDGGHASRLNLFTELLFYFIGIIIRHSTYYNHMMTTGV